MPESGKVQRDLATIITIIKYLLISALVIALVYLSFRLFILLLPFVAGLVLARSAIALANRIHPPKPPVSLPTSKKGKIPPEPRPETSAQTPAGPELTATPANLSSPPVALLNIRWAVAIYIILVFALIALVAGIIFISITQLRELATYVPQFLSQTDIATVVTDQMRRLTNLLGIVDEQTLTVIQQSLVEWQTGLVNAFPTLATKLLNSLGSFVGNLPAIFLTIIVILLSGYYFISDSANLYLFLDRSLNNKSFLKKSVNLFNILSQTLLRVIGGYMLLLIITFAMVLIGLILIDMPYAVVFALLAAIVDFLPVLGISATMIPIAIYQFVNANFWGGVGALITFLAVSIIRRFIEPPILGNALRLHPMATLFSMIVGVAAYGLGGILVGPVILVIAKEIMAQFGFDQKLRHMMGDLLSRIFD
ncbi:MAG: AI-2E family transporter [Clostridia bacterium]|nr:AI-2E family transporter [Clostridia bacterium]NCC76440.1 AI-2E family transporter [Clostridia bacterium]